MKRLLSRLRGNPVPPVMLQEVPEHVQRKSEEAHLLVVSRF